MIELLAVEKRRALDEHGSVTLGGFEEAWSSCWARMIAEHAWPHATQHRRGWRTAMLATRSEARAAWLDMETPFASAVQRLTDVAGAPLEPARVTRALLDLIGHTAVPDDREWTIV